MADPEDGWYYNLDTKKVEPWDGSKSANRLGPYASADEAGRALEKVAERNEKWDDDDAAWEGED